MKSHRKKILILLEILLIAGLGAWCYFTLTETHPRKPGEVEVTVQIPDARDKALLYKADDGTYHYRIHINTGQDEDLTADQLAARIHRARTTRSPGQKLLNISSPSEYAWVILGLLGQILFTGRMVVQLIVSEKNKKSTVPPMFWWMSLAGSTMLMIYFLWRQDPIGLLGQSFGWFIYIRNLWLIYFPPQQAAPDPIIHAEEEEATGPEPEDLPTGASAKTPTG